jgi:thioester reductase-like protein
MLALELRGLIQVFAGSTSQENFGLDPLHYAELEQQIDMMILNAWPVNFNVALEIIEGVIAGIKRSVDFAAASARRPHIAFVSSIASVMNLPAVHARGDDELLLVPEEFDPEKSLPAKQG